MPVKSEVLELVGHEVTITNPTKIFFPKLGIVERLVLPPVLGALGQFLAIAGWVAGG